MSRNSTALSARYGPNLSATNRNTNRRFLDVKVCATEHTVGVDLVCNLAKVNHFLLLSTNYGAG